MPWKVIPKGNEFCVYKLGADGEPTGETLGCHPTEEQAAAQARALYANEPEAGKRDVDPDVGGGVDRDKLKDSDFVFSDSRTFPVVRPGDVSDAVSSWGRYRGPHSFEEFKRRLIALCRRKGESFVNALPKEWDVKALLTVKAAGDWTLDVLGLPFGGPDGGKDAQGEYFSAQTRTHDDKWPSPPVVYYHGFTPEGLPSGEPAYIGRTIKRWTDQAGHWFRVVLDQSSEWARRVWEAAQQGLARASSGSVAHLVRKAADGHILEWPIAELSIFDAAEGRQPANAYAVALPVMKTVYQRAGLPWPDTDAPEVEAKAANTAPSAEQIDRADKQTLENEMEKQEIEKIVADALAGALKAQQDQVAAEAKAKAEEQAKIDAAVKAEKEKWETEQRRLPFKGMPYVREYHDEAYDELDAVEMALGYDILSDAKGRGLSKRWDPANETYLKSMALKAVAAEAKGDSAAHHGLKSLGLKANEIERSTLASYGDEWAGIMYGTALWEKIRAASNIVAKLPTKEVPQGFESISIPLEGADPKFYKVAQAVSLPTTELTGIPNATVTTSRVGTPTPASLTVGKMGARVLYTGEMEEDSLVPWLPTLRRQLELAGTEQLEHLIIDGDTETGASANINDIAGTPAATDLFLVLDGLRKLALVTNTANKRSAGTLTVEDFEDTLKLMGVAGKNAAQMDRVDFVIDPWTHYAAKLLPEVKTKDIFSAPTLENGVLTSIWGHKIHVSHFMCYAGVQLATISTEAYMLKSQAADGKVDQDTEADNVAGTILAVRWDQWLMGWKRRMTIETQRIPQADVTQIVALARVGLVYRDGEASALSYGVTL